jgi:hypothetical protein
MNNDKATSLITQIVLTVVSVVLLLINVLVLDALTGTNTPCKGIFYEASLVLAYLGSPILLSQIITGWILVSKNKFKAYYFSTVTPSGIWFVAITVCLTPFLLMQLGCWCGYFTWIKEDGISKSTMPQPQC